MVEIANSGVYEDSTYEKNVYVQLVTAEKRFFSVVQDSVDYTVLLTLPKGHQYGGIITIDLKLQGEKQDLHLDFLV